jgi:hypothetical protein
MKYALKLLALIIFLCSCNAYKTKYPYSLSDFRPELREHLEKLVSNPFLYYSSNETALNYLDNHTSDIELQRLLQSEHPILRALAFKYIIRRESVNINKILLRSLDDTAIISNHIGELDTYVADYIIDESQHKTSILKPALIETVITKYPYLAHSALFFLRKPSEDQKYYPYLKKIIDSKYRSHYRVEEELIAALSKYKKDIDSSRIVESLHNRWIHKEDKKFELVESNPIQAYFFTVEYYYSKLLSFKNEKLLQEMFQKGEEFDRPFERFVYATAAYKSRKAAAILIGLLNNKLYRQSSIKDKSRYADNYFQYMLWSAVKKYDSPFYKYIQLKTETIAKAYESKYTLGAYEAPYPDSVKEKNTW